MSIDFRSVTLKKPVGTIPLSSWHRPGYCPCQKPE